MITGEHNQKIKYLKSLDKRKYREENGCFYTEGHRTVIEGIISGVRPEMLVISELYTNSDAFRDLQEICFAYGIDAKQVLLPVSDKTFGAISETKTPQGIGGVFKIPRISIHELFQAKNIILLENLQDPGNMGTVIRTADAAGFDAVICGKGCVDVFNSKVLRSTAGSIFHINILQYDRDAYFAASILKENNFMLYCAHPKGNNSCFTQAFSKKNVIVIGNEANGLSGQMLTACDVAVTIPMPGRAESLNASVAAALMIYEIVRKSE